MNFLILSASMTGYTDLMSDHIEKTIKNAGHDVVRKQFGIDDIEVYELEDYDGVFIGSYSWNDFLPFEVEDFHQDLDLANINGKLFGLYGSCDSVYDVYGIALDALEEKIIESGGLVHEESIKFEIEADEEELEECEEFVLSFIDMVKKNNSNQNAS